MTGVICGCLMLKNNDQAEVGSAMIDVVLISDEIGIEVKFSI